MENTLLKRHQSFSGVEVVLVTVSALIVGVLLTAVLAAYSNLTTASIAEVSAENPMQTLAL